MQASINIRNCDKCGRAYQGTNPELCRNCLAEMEDDFTKVRGFVKDNPHVALDVVVEATGVDEKTVRMFVRQGRIDFSDSAGPILECQRCGKPIYRGDYCVLCASEISNRLKAASSTPKPKKRSSTMTFVRRYRSKR